MQFNTQITEIGNMAILSTKMIVVDQANDLAYFEHQLAGNVVVQTNHRGELLDLGRYSKLSEEKHGDHGRIYTGHFRSVNVWRNEQIVEESRWERPMFVHRYPKLMVVNFDYTENGIADEDSDDVFEADMDKEVLIRRAVAQITEDGEWDFLAGKSSKVVFVPKGMDPRKVLGKVWDEYLAAGKATNAQFIAGMLLRPGLQTEVSKSLPLPTRRGTAEMDGVGIVFPARDWEKVVAHYGLDPRTAALQVTYWNPKTGAAFKGTVSVETQGRPAGTYTETWKFLPAGVKSINLKYMSVMNSDFIINSRSSFNNQMAYYELNDQQRIRVTADYQLALDSIADLKSLAGAGHVITAGHLVAEGLSPFWGTSADEVNTIRKNMSLKACRNTPVPGWMLLVQPSLDLAEGEIRVPAAVYRRFKKAWKKGRLPKFMEALTQRHPTLPTGGSMQHYRVAGISKGNIVEIGMRPTPNVMVLNEKGNLVTMAEHFQHGHFKRWANAQLGDFDGDQVVIYDPFWVAERLFDFQPKLVDNQAKYKPRKGTSEGTDAVRRLEMFIKEETIAIGAGDSLARQMIDNGCETQERLEMCSLAIQSAITSKKHETDQVDLERPFGMKPVGECAFQQLKRLEEGQDVDAFVDHWMYPAVVQALETAEMHNEALEYSPNKLKQVYSDVSNMFSKAAVAEAYDMANEQIAYFSQLNKLGRATTDAVTKQQINRALKELRTVGLPLMVEEAGVFANWKPKGFVHHLNTEQDMRRALLSLAIAHQMPTELRVWAQTMDAKILKTFLVGRCGEDFVLLTGASEFEIVGDLIEVDVKDGVAFQAGRRIGRFAVDHNVPEDGHLVLRKVGGTERRHIVEAA